MSPGTAVATFDCKFEQLPWLHLHCGWVTALDSSWKAVNEIPNAAAVAGYVMAVLGVEMMMGKHMGNCENSVSWVKTDADYAGQMN